jgi:hypothetical protein
VKVPAATDKHADSLFNIWHGPSFAYLAGRYALAPLQGLISDSQRPLQAPLPAPVRFRDLAFLTPEPAAWEIVPVEIDGLTTIGESHLEATTAGDGLVFDDANAV